MTHDAESFAAHIRERIDKSSDFFKVKELCEQCNTNEAEYIDRDSVFLCVECIYKECFDD